MALKSCCCGCSPKTGSLIIGHICAGSSAVGVFFSIMSTLLVGDVDLSKYGLVPPGGDAEEINQHSKEILIKIHFLLAVVFLKSLIVNWLLIHGIKRTKPALVLPWIIFFAVGIAMQGVMAFAGISLAFFVPSELYYTGLVFFALVFCLQIYLLIVVSSHYHKMKKSSLLDEEQIMM